VEDTCGFVSWDDVASDAVEGKKATFYYMPRQLAPGWAGNGQRIEVRSFRAGRVDSRRNEAARVYVEFVRRGARTIRTALQRSRPNLVILEGWGHPEPPAGWLSNEDGSLSTKWTLFAPEWRAEMDTFLTQYLQAHPIARVLADFRDHPLSEKRADDTLPPSLVDVSSHAFLSTRSGSNLVEPQADAFRFPRPLSKTPPRPPNPPSMADDELTSVLQEKASIEHHSILLALEHDLTAKAWNDVQEIPGAIDLWARHPRLGFRVIFEVKTLTSDNELDQTRSALAQLLEYRLRYGHPSDRLCVVANRVVTQTRVSVLENLGAAVIWLTGKTFVAGSLWMRWMSET
jgi:hypothetical protein